MELTITMVLTGIVASIAYMAFNIITVQLYDYKTNHQHLDQLQQLNTLLLRDIDQATEIHVQGHNLVLEGIGVAYYFNSDNILRVMQNTVDTFHTSTSQWQWQPMLEQGTLVERLSFNATIDTISYPFYFHKQYDAYTLIHQP